VIRSSLLERLVLGRAVSFTTSKESMSMAKTWMRRLQSFKIGV